MVDVVGGAAPVAAMGADSWHLLGTMVDLPNALWDEGSGQTRCTIAHFLHH